VYYWDGIMVTFHLKNYFKYWYLKMVSHKWCGSLKAFVLSRFSFLAVSLTAVAYNDYISILGPTAVILHS